MRKIVFIVFGIIWHVFAHANVIKVGKREKTTSIKQAIAFANVNDTILVQAGLYKEGNIIIDKRVYLKGVNRPVLDGQKKI